MGFIMRRIIIIIMVFYSFKKLKLTVFMVINEICTFKYSDMV